MPWGRRRPAKKVLGGRAANAALARAHATAGVELGIDPAVAIGQCSVGHVFAAAHQGAGLRQGFECFVQWKRSLQRLRKALALRRGAGQKDNRGAGLSGHGQGVTCAGPLRQRLKTMAAPLTFLGIESSCDDTAAAVVRHVPGAAAQILSSVVEGQVALHADFGGVVPEIAARAHAERLDHCVEAALVQAGLSLRDLDGIAVTAGPGLIGGVLSGVMLAKGLAAGSGKPLVGVNHLAGHALTPRLTDGLAFPYLMLLVSGAILRFV